MWETDSGGGKCDGPGISRTPMHSTLHNSPAPVLVQVQLDGHGLHGEVSMASLGVAVVSRDAAADPCGRASNSTNKHSKTGTLQP